MMSGLVRADEASYAISWPVAPDYEIKYGVLRPKHGWRADREAPLSESDFFLSFAKLGAQGNPTEERILKWVRAYGLLSRADEGLDARHPLDKDVLVSVGSEQVILKAGELNQAPMSLNSFRKETRQAHACLRLLESIRGRNIGYLRSRMRFERIDLPDGSVSKASKRVIVDNQPIPFAVDISRELPDDEVRLAAAYGLERIIETKLKDVQIGFMPDRNRKHPRPLATYRPRLIAQCPDLNSALYYNFALLIADERPWTECDNCGRSMLLTRSDRQTCSPACRQAKSRKGRAARKSGKANRPT